MQALLQKISDLLSRKFLLTLLFGVGVPALFKQLGISDSVSLSGMALCASYFAANVLESKTQ